MWSDRGNAGLVGAERACELRVGRRRRARDYSPDRHDVRGRTCRREPGVAVCDELAVGYHSTERLDRNHLTGAGGRRGTKEHHALLE